MNKYNTNGNTSYCLGMSLTIEALKHQAKNIVKVVLSSKANKNEQLSYLLKLCDENKIIPEYDDSLIEKLSLKENCYCIGLFKKFYHTLQSNKHIVLYQFDDYGELGTTLRSAVSFNFKDIVLVDSDIDYFDPRCIRASMGSIFHTNIVHYENLDDYISNNQNQKIIPFVSHSNKELSELNLIDNFSLIISQKYDGLDKYKEIGYYLGHHHFEDISLSVRSSIILNYAYNQNLNR